MSMNSILTVSPSLFNPTLVAAAQELDPRDLITIGSSILTEYGDGVMVGVVSACDPEPDRWGDVWFLVEGFVVNQRTEPTFQSAWLLRSAVLVVIEL